MTRMAPGPHKKFAGDKSIIVVSVPYSGTRTVREHLGAYTLQHFSPVSVISPRDKIYVPIRHPMAVAKSWADRGRRLSDLLSAYTSMFYFFDTFRGEYEIIVSEGLSGRLGADDKKPTQGKDVWEYQQAVKRKVVARHFEFFRQFYRDPYSEDNYGLQEIPEEAGCDSGPPDGAGV